jgi:hypothetical protein
MTFFNYIQTIGCVVAILKCGPSFFVANYFGLYPLLWYPDHIFEVQNDLNPTMFCPLDVTSQSSNYDYFFGLKVFFDYIDRSYNTLELVHLEPFYLSPTFSCSNFMLTIPTFLNTNLR